MTTLSKRAQQYLELINSQQKTRAIDVLDEDFEFAFASRLQDLWETLSAAECREIVARLESAYPHRPECDDTGCVPGCAASGECCNKLANIYERKIERMRQALAPFAKEAARWDDAWVSPDDPTQVTIKSLRIADFFRARAALEDNK